MRALYSRFDSIIKAYYKKNHRVPTLDGIIDMNNELYTSNKEYINDVYKPMYDEIIKKYDKANRDNIIIENVKDLNLRDYQEQYIDESIKELNSNKRCLVVAPTGSGKTKIAFVIQSKLIKSNARMIYVFVSPLLRINKQCLKDSYIYYNKKFNTSSNFNKFAEIEVNSTNTKYHQTISNIINTTNNNILLSTTYKSLKHVFDLNLDIDLLILDEAHTIPSKVHNNKYFDNLKIEDKYELLSDEKESSAAEHISIKKNEWYNLFFSNKVKMRMFLTATPWKYQLNSFDKYGVPIDKIKIGDLIERNILSSIKTFVSRVNDKINITESHNYDRPDTAMSIMQFIKNTNRKRICIFVNNCKNAKLLKKCIVNSALYKSFNDASNIIIEPILYISSEANEISMFSNDETPDTFNANEVRIIISCKKLSMGIDIPCIDSIIFADPRMNTSDISQCIGRGLRYFNYDTTIKECCILLIKYLNDEDDKKNDMLYKYLDYLRKNAVFDHIKQIANKVTETMQSSPSKPKTEIMPEEYTINEINIYDGYLNLDIEYHSDYSKYIKDVNAKVGFKLDGFIKLLKSNNIKHPVIDKQKYIELETEYNIPLLNIIDIRNKYPAFGWILLNNNHNYYPTLNECEININKCKDILINALGFKTWKYINNDNKYLKIRELDSKIPNIHYTEFYIPSHFELDDKDMLSIPDIIINHDDITINTYTNYIYNDYTIFACKIDNTLIDLNYDTILNKIMKLVNIIKYDKFIYTNRIQEENKTINDYISLFVELTTLYKINIYIEFINNKKTHKIIYNYK